MPGGPHVAPPPSPPDQGSLSTQRGVSGCLSEVLPPRPAAGTSWAHALDGCEASHGVEGVLTVRGASASQRLAPKGFDASQYFHFKVN